MRSPKRPFISFSLALSKAPYAMHVENGDQKLYDHLDPTELTTANPHDDFMQMVDESEHASRLGIDLPSAYIIEQNDELVNLSDALAVDEFDGQKHKGKRLSLSTLVIDLALALRRKYHQLHIKKHEDDVDIDMST